MSTPPPAPPAAPAPMGQPAPEATNGLATASLITGIAAFVLCGLGVILGPVAVVLGAISVKRGVKKAQAIWGIVLGALATVGSALGIMGLIWIMSMDSGSEQLDRVPAEQNEHEQAEPAPTDGMTDGLEDLLEALEDDQSTTGAYAGGLQQTPCYEFEGRTGWVANTSAERLDACFMDYELWLTYTIDADGNLDVSDVGVGGIEGQIVVEPISDGFVETNFPDLDDETVRAVMRDEFLTTADMTVTSIDDAVLGGVPASRFQMDSPRSDTRVVYTVFTPTAYEVTPDVSSSFFMITIQNTFDEFESGADIEQRLVDSFTWR